MCISGTQKRHATDAEAAHTQHALSVLYRRALAQHPFRRVVREILVALHDEAETGSAERRVTARQRQNLRPAQSVEAQLSRS
jgi:hypothetical protein